MCHTSSEGWPSTGLLGRPGASTIGRRVRRLLSREPDYPECRSQDCLPVGRGQPRSARSAVDWLPWESFAASLGLHPGRVTGLVTGGTSIRNRLASHPATPPYSENALSQPWARPGGLDEPDERIRRLDDTGPGRQAWGATEAPRLDVRPPVRPPRRSRVESGFGPVWERRSEWARPVRRSDR